MITGFWGGMGFNPWATFDWNVAGHGFLVTPFFSTAQQYVARVLSGLFIIGMYWGNTCWSAYMPINSNESFANDGKKYNVTRIANKAGDGVDLDAYKAYGPPFFSGANVFGQGAWFAWYPMTLFSVSIQHWDGLKKSAIEMYKGVRHRRSIYETFHDPHTRIMKAYPEVPDWWFACVLLLSLALGIVALTVWPLTVPVWALFAVVGISAIMLIPSVLLLASANIGMGFNALFQLLGGVWFVGKPEASIILTAFGQNFNAQADSYITDQKMGHYAKVPPRAVFRGQVISILCNCFIFVGMLDWMVVNFDNGALCQWSNAQHFVCADAVLVYASAIEYGAFGVKNMFELYPILPWCFFIGSVVGIAWGVSRRYVPAIRAYVQRRLPGDMSSTLEKYLFRPLSYLYWFEPAVFWTGALNWTGGNNLSYATNGLYVSFVFMCYIKRHYGAWWEKYNYLVEAGFGVGVALSAIVQTFAFAFTGIELTWWGNTVSKAGVDYQAYNQNATLLTLPASGYFGPSPDQYPMKFT
ncbi:Uu.00g022580.m01.CDS01 [Anthostomella pinea]|uniref:Uu.00g022580.m01.CDS01 n=1 Tax=Anthostomella pinea TaxID=933095 RepID=A0AAI8VZV2_9PEZI|nr:Uu.00g022580.m01.CDS01 [Anthostomella pinea]